MKMFTSPTATADELEHDHYLSPNDTYYDSDDDDGTELSSSLRSLANTSTGTINLGSIRVEGWLNHTTSSKTVSKKKKQTKQPKYFVLRGGTLSYYGRRHDVKAKGTFVLTRGCTVGPVIFGSFDDSLTGSGETGGGGASHVEQGDNTTGATTSIESKSSNKSKKKKTQYHCFQITWPIHDKPSKDEKYMAQAKAQVAAESENEAMQQQQLGQKASLEIVTTHTAANPRSPKSLLARASSASTRRELSPRSAKPYHPRRSESHGGQSVQSLPLDITLPLENELDYGKVNIKPSSNHDNYSHSQIQESASTSTLTTSNVKRDVLFTPANALVGMKPLSETQKSQSSTQAVTSMHHELGLHKHYTQQIEKHAKDQQKSVEESIKVKLLLTKNENRQKLKKKMFQGTKVAAVSTAAITAGVLTAGIGLAAGLVFVGITAAAGGSGAVVGSKVLDKAKGKYYQKESRRVFRLIVGANTHEEAMRWKMAIEHAILELVLESKEEEEDDLDVESIFVEQEKAKWIVGGDGLVVDAAKANLSGGKATVMPTPKRCGASPANIRDQTQIVTSPVNKNAAYLEPVTRWVPIQGGGIALWGILGALGGGGNLRICREERSKHPSWFATENATSAFPKIPRFRSEVGFAGQPFSPFKSSIVLKANSLDAFMSLMCSGRIHGSADAVNISGVASASTLVPNSGQIASFRIIETMDDHMDVIHLVFRPLYLFPSWTAPRDFVLYRFWKFDDDGTYQVCVDSVQHRDCPPLAGYVRGEMHSVYTIAPLKQKKRRSAKASAAGSGPTSRPNLSNDECLLSQVVQLDPRGWVPTTSSLPLFRSQGYGDAFAIMALHQMLDVREALDLARFVAVPMDDAHNSGRQGKRVKNPRQNRLVRKAKLGQRQTSGGGRGSGGESIFVPSLEVSESVDISDEEEPDVENYDFKYSSTELSLRGSCVDNSSSHNIRIGTIAESIQTNSIPSTYAELSSQTIYTHPSPMIKSWWAEPDANSFRVRGKTYISDKCKINAGPSLFQLIAADIVETDVPIMTGMCRHPKERVQLALEREKQAKSIGLLSTDMPPFVFAVNIALPGPPNYHMVFYYAVDNISMIDGSDGTPSSKLCQKFFFGNDDAFRDNTFKLIPQIIEGNFMVRKAVGR